VSRSANEERYVRFPMTGTNDGRREPDRGAAARAGGGSDPPLLTGGLLHSPTQYSRGVDFLTFTAPSASGEVLCSRFPFIRDGSGAAEGFRRSEIRSTMGGECFRRVEPVSPSRAYGLSYESWEWSGVQAHLVASDVSVLDGRASRLDVAFDFAVHDDVTACVVAGLIASHLAAKGITPGVSGEGRHFTHYAGSSSSESRVRIYRKDLQYGQAWLSSIHPCVLRVELILRRREAARALQLGVGDEMYAHAAAKIEGLTGLVVQGVRKILPVLDVRPEIDVAQQYFEFQRSWSRKLVEWAALGLNVQDDAKYICDMQPAAASRMSEWRQRQRANAMQAADVDEVRRNYQACVRRLRGGVPRP